ncbi:hypothetical protein, conserved [Eimeria brunetti]|uniref:Uncharacterized protein n=1 Tax=Eimeria brunetti TaxID=51314 RepID=U6LYU6_9EIME|nr:hypothetical protein, conserved [Eimeria brunetti]
MSFRDCISTRQPAARKEAPSAAAPQPQAAASSAPHTPSASCEEDVFLSPRSVIGANEPAAEAPSSAAAFGEPAGCFQDHEEGTGAAELPKGGRETQGNATSSNGVHLQPAARRPFTHAPSAAASLWSGGLGRGGRFSHSMIPASAPITFTKTYGSTVQWGAYTRNPQGYLNAEAVQAAAAAAAAAEENLANFQYSTDALAPHLPKDTGRTDSVYTAQEPIEAQRENTRNAVTAQPCNSPGTMRNTGNNSSTRREAAGGLPPHASSSRRQSTRAAGSSRPILGSWLFKGSGASTELERLLKEENDIAETAAARSELAATKLLQEDMEAMLANLQQVKAFLVSKLRECETALLTTAQERDDLEATLQQIQSGIQDSVADNRRQAEECKEKLLQKEREVEELKAQLEEARAEATALKKENEILKAEVNVARVEAADVAAAEGFRIEEYRAALQTLMERNKAQRRELKRLRGQLIKTREDLASALARVDELETLEEFRKSQLYSNEAEAAAAAATAAASASAAREKTPCSGSGRSVANQEGPSGGPSSSSSGTPSDEWGSPTCRLQQTETQGDGGGENSGCSCDTGCARRGSEDGSGDPGLPRCTDSSSGGSSNPRNACANTPSGQGLGRSVKGLLTTGVAQLLQRIESAISAERDPRELSTDNESHASEEPLPEEERGLHEEAELFLQRTRGSSSDLIVRLEDGQQQQSASEGGREEGGANNSPQGEYDSRTLTNVARNMWQAAHELLADRAIPPARLSTLRTVAAGNPSAWEVLRERHRAAKSMPLFSSIPPSAYPLTPQGGRRGSPMRLSSSTSAGARPRAAASSSFSRTAAAQAGRRGSAGAACAAGAAAGFNLRPLGRVERGRRGGSPPAYMTVELPSEAACMSACTSGALSDTAVEASERPRDIKRAATPSERERETRTPTGTEQAAGSAAAAESPPHSPAAAE